MNEDDLRRTLELAGLTRYQADVYLALLTLRDAPAATIAEASGVPGPRVYDVLRELEGEGYLELYDRGQLHARLHDPAPLIRTLGSRAAAFERATAALAERYERPPRDLHPVSIVKREATVFDRAAEAIAAADYRVALCVSAGSVGRFDASLEEAYARGVYVEVCVAGDPEQDLDPGRFENRCSEVRRRDIPAPFLGMVDRDTVCFAPLARSTNRYGVIVHDASHAYVFNVFFRASLWLPWPTIHRDGVAEAGTVFVDVGTCVDALRGPLEAGETVHAHITGTAVGSDEPVSLEGRVVAVEHHPEAAPQHPSTSLAPRVSLTVETAEGPVTVGGWGASAEDVEAATITIEHVDRA